MPVFLCFAVHYIPDPSNSLFGSVRGMNGNVRFHFQGQACYLAKGPHQRETHILGRDERTFRIISAATLEGEDRTIYRKADFIFGE